MPDPDALIATVAGGQLRGERCDGVRRFLGIPYAAAPVGARRWKPPQPAEGWTGVRDARRFGPASMQPDAPFHPTWRASNASEDCLHLNVWTPEGARDLPVMVVIHGGGFQIGSGEIPVYDGADLARRNIVVVTFNYRLGLLGFVGGANWLHDQIAALRWVADNIAAFGGDPARVTIIGCSAGGVSVNALLTTPAAAGLFSQAITISGGGDAMFADAPGAATPGDFADDAVPVHAEAFPGGAGDRPHVDGDLIVGFPSVALAQGPVNAKRWIVGFCDYESSILDDLGIDAKAFAPMLAPMVSPSDHDGDIAAIDGHALYEHLFFRAPAMTLAALGRAAGVETYVFDYRHAPSPLRGALPGSPHTLAMSAVLGNLDAAFEELGAVPAAEDRQANRAWQDRFVAFAYGAPPDAPKAPSWPQYAGVGGDALIVAADGRQSIGTPETLGERAAHYARRSE